MISTTKTSHRFKLNVVTSGSCLVMPRPE